MKVTKFHLCFVTFRNVSAKREEVLIICVKEHPGASAVCRAAISFPESSFPLTSGSGYERLWDKAFSDNRILVIPVELRRRE